MDEEPKKNENLTEDSTEEVKPSKEIKEETEEEQKQEETQEEEKQEETEAKTDIEKEEKQFQHEEKRIEKQETILQNLNFWRVLSVLLAIAVIFIFMNKPAPADTPSGTDSALSSEDQFIFLKSTACGQACDDIEPAAKEMAEKAGLEFKKVSYAQPAQLPGAVIINEGELTITGIESEAALTVQLCAMTDNSEICADADQAKQDLEGQAEEAQKAQLEAQKKALEDIPKKDMPEVELFVMSHCPFGTQIEKGMLPVADLLGDKIDFKVKFVYYAMHGETEVNEQMLQHCIQSEQEDKFIAYLSCFLEAGDTQNCLEKTEIDTDKADACVEETDKEFKITEKLEDQASWLNGRFPLFDISKEENEKYQVRGSPTLVVNGQTVSSGRDSTSILAAVCAGFDEQPEECNEELSSAPPSSGFGYGGEGDAGAATCG